MLYVQTLKHRYQNIRNTLVLPMRQLRHALCLYGKLSQARRVFNCCAIVLRKEDFSSWFILVPVVAAHML